MVGLYIDALSDEQRDRIIEAKNWTPDFVDPEDPTCRCLVGHAEDWAHWGVSRDPALSMSRDTHNHHGHPIYNVVPLLFNRFGKDRIVRLCKERAAKANRIHIGEQAKAKVYAGILQRSVR